jgi:hypothetical protein
VVRDKLRSSAISCRYWVGARLTEAKAGPTKTMIPDSLQRKVLAPTRAGPIANLLLPGFPL